MAEIDALTDEIAGLVHHLVARWDTYLNDRVRELDLGITGRQAVALFLARDPLAMRELADRMACDPASATGIVDRLEAKGLVVRVPDPTDRRSKRVELTAEGRRLRRRIEQRVMANRPSIAGLDEQEKRQLKGLLEKAMQGL